MPTELSPQLIGQTEKTMNAILERILADRVSEPEWVALVVIAGIRNAEDATGVDARVAAALKVKPQIASALLTSLSNKGRVEIGPSFGATLTTSGRQLLEEVRSENRSVVQRLWGDLPAAELSVAATVLTTVLERAELELAAPA